MTPNYADQRAMALIAIPNRWLLAKTLHGWDIRHNNGELIACWCDLTNGRPTRKDGQA